MVHNYSGKWQSKRTVTNSVIIKILVQTKPLKNAQIGLPLLEEFLL